jgi:hypothetical protein
MATSDAPGEGDGPAPFASIAVRETGFDVDYEVESYPREGDPYDVSLTIHVGETGVAFDVDRATAQALAQDLLGEVRKLENSRVSSGGF